METHKYEINQNERRIVETVFSLHLAGKNCTEIVAALFEMGYRKRNGNPIDKRTVQGILRNEKYTGVYLLRCKSPARSNTAYEEIRVEGGMPVIIPKSMFEDAQEILNAAPKSKSA